MHATSCQRITQLLRQFESPLEIDPSKSEEISSPVAVSHMTSLTDSQSVSDEIERDMESISRFAHSFADVKTKLDNFNRNYLELLPDLYSMEEQRVSLNIECQSTFSTSHRCSGPAQVQVRFMEKTLNPVISESLKVNRNTYRQEVSMLTNRDGLEDLCFSALHMTNVIHYLIKNTTNPIHTADVTQSIYEAGSNLFYRLADMNSGDRWRCPATQHLLTMCLDLLGQIFICGRSDQAVPLLEQMLKKPEIAALLSTHFSPAKACQRINNAGGMQVQCDTAIFVDMYERVINAAVSENSQNSPDVMFVLITKFDMAAWCQEFTPPKGDLKRMLHAIVLGLIQHSNQNIINTKGQDDDTLPMVMSRSQSSQLHLSNSAVQEIFTTHLCTLVQHSTSMLFYDALNLLLTASHQNTLEPMVWEAVISTTFESLESKSHDVPVLSYECVDISIKHLAVFFSEQGNKLNRDLYRKWKPYVQPLSRLLCRLCVTEVDIQDNRRASNSNSDHITHLGSLQNVVLPMFSPWLTASMEDQSNILWPWESGDQDLATSMLSAFSSTLAVICNEKTVDISSCVASLWRFYLQNVMVAYDVFAPSYICCSYQTSLSTIPWHKFIPNLTDLDTMIQLCNSKLDCSVHFLCHIISDIDWRLILRMCHLTDREDLTQRWSEHTPEILCRLLHLLFILGSHKDRLVSYPKLHSLFTAIDDFPWSLIAYEQLDYLANLVSDRYDAFCLLKSYPTDGRTKRDQDPRYIVLRLLQAVAGVRFYDKDEMPAMNENLGDNDAEEEEISWMKRQSYIRCAGRLVRTTARTQAKYELKALEAIVRLLVEKIMKSLLIVINTETSQERSNLTSVYGELWRFVNTFPEKLQEPVRSQILSCLIDTVNSELINATDPGAEISTETARVLTCLISSAYDTLTDPAHLAPVLEQCYDTCLVLLVKLNGEKVAENGTRFPKSHSFTLNELSNGFNLKLWEDVCAVFVRSPKFPRQELVEVCISNGYINTLYALARHIFKDQENGNEKQKTEAYDCCLSIVQWISSCNPKPENEIKLLMLISHFLSSCEYLMRVTKTNSDSDINTHSVADVLASPLHTFEQWSMDRVKVGILGSLGIGRASSLSLGFRISLHCLVTYIRQSISQLSPNNSEHMEAATQAIESLRRLPTENRIYSSESNKITKLCNLIEGCSSGRRSDVYRVLMQTLICDFFLKYKHHCLVL